MRSKSSRFIFPGSLFICYTIGKKSSSKNSFENKKRIYLKTFPHK